MWVMSMRKINLSGKRFGRLLVLFESNSVAGKSMWTCQCDCKKSVVVRGTHMTGGKVNSCGCLRHELFIGRVTTHGLSKTRVYGIWERMLSRCSNSEDKNYCNYGARGIKVCDEWQGFPEKNVRFWSSCALFPGRCQNLLPRECRFAA